MLKRLIIIIFSIFFITNSAKTNEIKIVYIDVDRIMNQSDVGKDLSKQLESLNNKNIEKFKKKEKELAEIEKNIIKQKNILSKEEFEKKVNNLQSNIRNYKNNINVSSKDISKKRIEATSKILTALKPILAEYSEKNSISLILEKKSVVIGKSELEITNQILELVNKKIKKIKLN